MTLPICICALSVILVSLQAEDQSKAEGYFTNSNNCFGPGRKEYLNITVTEGGEWQALKVVGDKNIPRGRVSFVTRNCRDYDFPTHPSPGALQIREDENDPNGFTWMDAVVITYSEDNDTWTFGVLDGGECVFEGTLIRTTEEEVHYAVTTLVFLMTAVCSC